MIDVIFITRLRLRFSNLCEHKFKDNFQDTLNQVCSCSTEAESFSNYFLCCHWFDALRATLMNNLRNIDSDVPNILSYGNQIYEDKTNQII